MTWHPAWQFVAEILVAPGTLGLAGATLALVSKSRGMMQVSQRALEAGVRPLLADPQFVDASRPDETLLFGAPGRISPSVPYGSLFHDQMADGGVSHFSVAFENVGSGVAAIHGWRTEPNLPGDVYASRKFVPVGSLLRINVSVLRGMPGAERFDDQWWAMDGIDIIVEYSDTYGGHTLISTASIRQYATQGPFVQGITVQKVTDGVVIASGTSSY